LESFKSSAFYDTHRVIRGKFVLSATIKTDELRITSMIESVGFDRLYSTIVRYVPETLSYAALVVGIRYQLGPVDRTP